MRKVENINVYYGKIHAIKDVSFEVNDGEIVALIGANGAGKSTILKTVSGLLRTRTGGITFNEENIAHIEAHKEQNIEANRQHRSHKTTRGVQGGLPLGTDILGRGSVQIGNDHVAGDQPDVAVKNIEQAEDGDKHPKNRRNHGKDGKTRGKDRPPVLLSVKGKTENTLADSGTRQRHQQVCGLRNKVGRTVLPRC